MFDRRNFLTGSALVAGAATLGSTLNADDDHTNTASVDGHRLPDFKKGSRLLFQGDSITDMKWGRNEKDRNHYLGHSYVYLIAARLGVEMPEAQLDFYNRGMSGHRIADLKSRWQKDAVDMKPDVLSILIGINDVSQGGGKQVPLQQWESDYRSILESSQNANSELRLVLLDPFVLRSGRLTNEAPWKRWTGSAVSSLDWPLNMTRSTSRRKKSSTLQPNPFRQRIGSGTEFIPYPKAMNSLHATG